jgi:hypothetical protein
MADLPDSPLERAQMLEALMIARATGELTANNNVYSILRREFMDHQRLRALLPDFVRINRTLDMFWPYIKKSAGTYAERRQIIGAGFTPLIDFLMMKDQAPPDALVSDKLRTFDSAGVHEVWEKALARRVNDPEGAITIARTLVETVCKRILDELSIAYSDRDDLPKLYSAVAKSLNLAPDQHSAEAVRAILGGAITVVNGLGTLRNKLSDSHGRGGAPVKPTSRHAHLAVNMAGALATFLVETHQHRAGSSA